MTFLPSDQEASGRSFGVEEIDLLSEVIESGRLFAPKGRFVKELESGFAQWLGVGHTVASSSGTAAIHTALAAIDPEPGDEVITTSITDIGGLTPILYQGAVPVFADVDARTGNVTAATVEQRISERTRAIMVTHLFGNPAQVGEICELAARHDIPVIEDCAQAFGATVGGEKVGGFGAIGTFSLQQGKHITTGEGGLTATNDAGLAKTMRLFVNKAWDYDDPTDHDFLALNYRMAELQGAVGLAQLGRLDAGVETRRVNARALDERISGIEGIEPVTVPSDAESSFWRYCLLVDVNTVPGGPDALADKLRDLGVPSAPRYIKKPAYRTRVFEEQKTFGSSRWPFTLARPEAVDYSDHLFPGTLDFLRHVLVLPWNERMEDDHVDRIAEALATGVASLGQEAA
jgi:dTDP-4-amino-4,6-dideoxygalactose transaminase